MEIIAKTKTGVLIEATNHEVREIINSVTGKKLDELSVGQKIPAIDYSSTITKIKSLENEWKYQKVIEYSKEFIEYIKDLEKVVSDASNIEL